MTVYGSGRENLQRLPEDKPMEQYLVQSKEDKEKTKEGEGEKKIKEKNQ